MQHFFKLKAARWKTTQDLTETTRYMFESFTPEDNEQSDNKQQKLFRALIKNR